MYIGPEGDEEGFAEEDLEVGMAYLAKKVCYSNWLNRSEIV